MQRDRDGFRAESRELGWGPWLFAQGLLWAVGLTFLAASAVVERPRWGFVTVLISVTGGLGLARAYHRHQRRNSDNG